MAELTVRQDELVVTMEPREIRSLTWLGLRKSRRSALTRGLYDPPDKDPWVGIFQVKEDGVWEKKLCFIYGQHSPVVAVDLDQDNQAAFTRLVVSLEHTSDSVAASIKAAAGLV
jgi:hypothetical protein